MRWLAAIVVVVAVGGCSRDDADLPVAISQCLAKNSSQGDVQRVGEQLLAAAQRLGEEERRCRSDISSARCGGVRSGVWEPIRSSCGASSTRRGLFAAHPALRAACAPAVVLVRCRT